MSRDDRQATVDRRKFLAGVAVAGAASAVTPPGVATAATSATVPSAPAPRPSALPPSAVVAAAETGTPKELARATRPDGSDFMVDVIKSLDIEYLPSNPASSFRGLHESLINYGGNKKPEFLTCTHEECAVAMAHGYFKIAGKPMMTLCHGTVGLQHASMAIYNAWCDRVPVIVVGGNDLDASKRPPGVPTFHSAQDINALVRDFTKWDDTPVSLQHFAQSFVRAYKIAMTPPYAPVAISLDAGLQQEPIHGNGESLSIPRYVPTVAAGRRSQCGREAARLLANAERPVIVVDRAARTHERRRAPGRARRAAAGAGGRPGRADEFPEHAPPHRQPAAVGDRPGRRDHRHGAVRLLGDREPVGRQRRARPGRSRNPASSRGPSSSASARSSLLTKANYQDFQRFQVVDVHMAADAETTLPMLIEAVKAAIPADRRAAIEKRGEAHRKARQEARQRMLEAAAVAWDASPISTARLAAEIWPLIKGLDWSMVGSDRQMSDWPSRLWAMEKHYHHLGHSGGYRPRLQSVGRGRRGAGQSGASGASRSTCSRMAISCTRRACCGRRRITRSRCSP